ncbi:glycosyltransferase family 4 protein [Halostella pelagica]|uniref:glycosyltransferase family 4 protein n=1 Tax=Halostella pelagica TaxID=2583824 RepID=UPI00108219B2|nr:glycosyltransferase family 4 protein [Halostella pelagica]
MDHQVAAFTDTYLPTVNGVTYTIKTWSERWNRNGGRMDVVYPRADGHTAGPREHPVRSVAFPWYDGYRLGTPKVPAAVSNVDVVHAHTPYALGLGAMRLSRRTDAPLVASYHTPGGEYTDYLAPTDGIASGLEGFVEGYERWFFNRADAVLVPTAPIRDHLLDTVGIDSHVEVVSNGIDTERFRPTDPAAFREKYGLEGETLVGYTGRHGYEKRLSDLLEAAEGLDITVVLGGDGPARADLEAQAERTDLDVRFLGFLDRDEMPAFYSALDVFAFPSPVETQGLVALEANACGTAVVAVDSGALSETIDDGVTGYHFTPGNVAAFREKIEDALADRERLGENCLERRETVSVDRAVERLADVYDSVL